MIGAGGGDVLDGGTGRDNVSYATSNVAVDINLGTGVGTGGDADGDSFVSIEDVTGSDFNDNLTGSAGQNTLTGGAGNDILSGGGDADILIGGDGSDTTSYADSAAGVNVDLQNNVTSGGDAAGDSLSSIENIIGSGHDDVLIGSVFDNAISGGAGNDTLKGGAGADALDGGAGIDTADYSSSLQAVTVDLAAGTASGGEAQGDTLSNIENVIGGVDADILSIGTIIAR